MSENGPILYALYGAHGKSMDSNGLGTATSLFETLNQLLC